jgi:hypothetical protein
MESNMKVLVAVISGYTVMVYENNSLVGYLTEHFGSTSEAWSYAQSITDNIEFE